ncbi:fasciclin domain-containing protein [Actinomycetes bacterium KLBMP 9759]
MRRAAAVAVLASMAVLGACSTSSAPPPAAPASAAPAAPTSAAPPASNGVTTPAAAFGPSCGAFPQGDAPGSLAVIERQPVAQATAGNPLLTTFMTAVGAVPALADTMNQQRGVTVFAPYNGAFDDARRTVGEPAFTTMLSDPSEVADLLADHVLGRRLDAKGLVAAGTVTTLGGEELTVGGTPESPTLTSGDGVEARVLCGDVPTLNATVFVIDKVLLPKT